MLTHLFRSHRDPDWHDQPGDPLVARLEALAADQPDLERRVARDRMAMRAAFLEARTRGTARASRALVPRRLAVSFAAAALLVVLSAGGIAATSPGLPLFDVRLAVEELLLPSDADARLTAQLDRLDRRLDEASRAFAAGDRAAMSAALRAYDAIAARITAGAPPAGSDLTTAMARVGSQVQRLLRLQVADAPTDPDRAMRTARSVLVWLATPPGSDDPMPGGPTGTPPGATPAATPTGTSRATPEAGPSATPAGGTSTSTPAGSPHPIGTPTTGDGGHGKTPEPRQTSGPNDGPGGSPAPH